MSTQTIEARFWDRVDMSAGPDACWPWTGATGSNGRGRVIRDGKPKYAYRIAWEYANGTTFPEGLSACHECDNPACCNPRHITPGTPAYNMAGARERGRTRNGPRWGLDHHKVTFGPDEVAQIVAEYLAGGITQAELARRWGTSQTSVSNWVRAEVRPDAGVEPTPIGRGRRPQVGLKPCGTHAAYVRHIRRGEKACDACLAAERAHCLEQRTRRQERHVGAEHVADGAA